MHTSTQPIHEVMHWKSLKIDLTALQSEEEAPTPAGGRPSARSMVVSDQQVNDRLVQKMKELAYVDHRESRGVEKRKRGTWKRGRERGKWIKALVEWYK